MAYQVTLQPSGHSFEADGDATLLEAALDAGIHLPYGCRNGACGACKTKVVAGEVDHGAAMEFVLTPEDRAAGYALACCAKARRRRSASARRCARCVAGCSTRVSLMSSPRQSP